MFKKVSLIIFLSIVLAGFLVGRHFYLLRSSDATVVDRLPNGDFLVRAKILNLAQETTGMFHFNKVEFRDFLSKEFLLGQAKSYGLDLQRPVYGFANEDGTWGVMIHVSDSSEIGAGIARLEKVFKIENAIVGGQKVYKYKEEEGYLAYGKNWLFIYKGDQFDRHIRRVADANKGDISENWNSFLKEKTYRKKNLVIYANNRRTQRYGIEKALFAHNVDSVSITLLSYARAINRFRFKQKRGGQAFDLRSGSSKYLNLHLDIEEFIKEKDDPLYLLMAKLSRKISFPLDDFLNAWKGDVSFTEGGYQLVKESFIESVMDDNFEITEVTTTKETKVKGFSLALSMNKNANSLIGKLLNKGILTEEEGKYRFLISPQLNMKKIGEYYLFYSGTNAPRLISSEANNGYLSYRGTPFTFNLEGINRKEVFGQIEFPVRRILRRNKFF